MLVPDNLCQHLSGLLRQASARLVGVTGSVWWGGIPCFAGLSNGVLQWSVMLLCTASFFCKDRVLSPVASIW